MFIVKKTTMTLLALLTIIVMLLTPIYDSAGLSAVNFPSESMSENINTPFTASEPNPIPNQGAEPVVTWSSFPSPPEQSLAYTSIEFTDINLDGKIDIVAGYDSMGILIWVGNGNGVWNAFVSPTSASKYNDITIGDINNDGKPDIVAVGTTGIEVWSGDASGSWTGANTGLPINGEYFAVTLADIDLDGNLDIIAGTQGQIFVKKGVQVYLGDGNGAWTSGDASMPDNGKYYGVSTGDFNLDGKPDIAAASNNGVDVWEGDGSGNWTLRDNGLASSDSFSDIKFSDFNLDGELDIVASGSNNNGVTVWNGNGVGSWVMTFDLPLTGTYTGVEIADINIDGYMDIISSSTTTNEVAWSGDGSDRWFLQNSGLSSSSHSTDLSIADVNNDARVDMGLIDTNGSIILWRSSVSRTVNTWDVFNAPPSSANIRDIEVFDINQDARMDISYATASNGIEIWTGDGTGTWTNFTAPTTLREFYSLKAVDFDHDGNMDLVATSDRGIYAWSGDGIGTWTSRRNGLPTFSPYLGLAVADFNDDGNLDIVAGADGGGITVWNGNGVGSWVMTFNLPFTGSYYDVTFGDVNHDGNIDIIAADNGIRVFLGDGNDGWIESSAGLPDTTNSYKAVEIDDIDNDGDMDIIGADNITNGVKVWMGDGTGSWTFDSLVTGTLSRGLGLADIDIDGKTDISSGSNGSDTGISCYTQDGGPWTSVSDGLPQTGEFFSIELADINIDGRVDIITADSLAPKIWVGNYSVPSSTYDIDVSMVAAGDWVFVSFPITASGDALTIFDDAAWSSGTTDWDRLYWYDPTDAADHWKSYNKAHAALGIIEDMPLINNTMGLWMHLTASDGALTIGSGAAPTATTISLKAGWNMVGYPSTTETYTAQALMDDSGGLVTRIERFNASAVYDIEVMPASDTFLIGQAYWVYSASAYDWVIP